MINKDEQVIGRKKGIYVEESQECNFELLTGLYLRAQATKVPTF